MITAQLLQCSSSTVNQESKQLCSFPGLAGGLVGWNTLVTHEYKLLKLSQFILDISFSLQL